MTIPSAYQAYYSSDDTEETEQESVTVVLLGADSRENGAFPTILGMLEKGTYVTVTFSDVEGGYAWQ